MICPICKNEIKDEAIFCTKCGKRIPRCPTCNKVISQKMRFCMNDGTPLPEEVISIFSSQLPAESIKPKSIEGIMKENTITETVADKSSNIIPVRTPMSDVTKTKEKRNYCVHCGALCLNTEILCAKCQKATRNSNKGLSKKTQIVLFLCSVVVIGIIGVLGYSIYNGNISLDFFPQIMVGNTKDKLTNDDPNIVMTQNSTDEERATEDITYSTEIIEQVPQNTEQVISTIDSFSTESVSETVETESIFSEQNTTETEVKNEVPQISMDAILSVSATSYLSETEYNLIHQPSNLIDGSLSNAWVENVPGKGEGESVTIYFNGIYKVSGFIINAGYQKNSDVYSKNSRPAKVLITFSDGSSMDTILDDINDMQQVLFPSVVETSSVTITIQTVYPGSKYQDTAISEIQLF